MKMKKIIIIIMLVGLFKVNYGQQEKEFAEYGISGSLSPFGISLSMSYNKTNKTSFIVSLGGLPESNSLIKPKINNINEYEMTSESSWMGVFVNHRPFKEMEWIRVNFGMAIGSIENTLVEPPGGGEYKVLYNNPPSGYIGLGVGQQTKKGLVFGVDFGLLYGPGPIITGPVNSKIESISNSSVAGKVLPNIQFSLGFNFD